MGKHRYFIFSSYSPYPFSATFSYVCPRSTVCNSSILLNFLFLSQRFFFATPTLHYWMWKHRWGNKLYTRATGIYNRINALKIFITIEENYLKRSVQFFIFAGQQKKNKKNNNLETKGFLHSTNKEEKIF